jgi:ABC-2 type transport system ATP-binding protein
MVEIKELTFGYDKKKLLFEGLNLTLMAGHIYGLLGKNGAGKSTLIKNIIGLAFPKKGICQINGIDSSDRSPDVLQNLFLVPEEICLPRLSIQRFADNTKVFYPRFDEGQFLAYLKEFEISVEVNISDLSFGQQKKTLIAFALAANTSLLVMDEPTNGLDIPSKVQFRRIIASALTEDRCILISTHQVRDLDNLIDSLIVLNNRQIVLNASVDFIGEQLTFTSVNSLDDESVLYFESSFKGHSVIMPNSTRKSNRVDLELLFNALIADNSKLINEFKLPT